MTKIKNKKIVSGRPQKGAFRHNLGQIPTCATPSKMRLPRSGQRLEFIEKRYGSRLNPAAKLSNNDMPGGSDPVQIARPRLRRFAPGVAMCR